ncbi:LacI family DNA-binding transcriptional regulator [Paenibacillus sp. MBLB4367]|uniref:LacI family DNA-binding transcriptional regulator n=1 Tax=Paenibacillus sp. MBLB4367 TaxID=3384767 RepID=UPI0039082F00
MKESKDEQAGQNGVKDKDESAMTEPTDKTASKAATASAPKRSGRSQNRTVTVVNVAEEAGVSIATVSNVLNRRDVPLSDEVIRKVEEAASRLGYRKNRMAASLSKQRTNELGMLIPGFGSYFGQLAEEMENLAHQCGYHLSVFSSRLNPAKEKRHLEALLERRVDGLFCHGLTMSHESIKRLVGSETPIMLFNAWEWPSDAAVGIVNLDFYAACVQAVRYLHAKGCGTLIYLGSKSAEATDRQRRGGFTEGCLALPKNCGVHVVEMSDRSAEQAIEEIVRIRAAAGSTGPVGMIGFDDHVAFGVMMKLLERGYAVPEQFQVIGINDEAFARDSYPSMSTFAIPHKRQAKLMIEWLLTHLGEGRKLEKAGLDPYAQPAEIKEHHIPVTFVPRMSTEGKG